MKDLIRIRGSACAIALILLLSQTACGPKMPAETSAATAQITEEETETAAAETEIDISVIEDTDDSQPKLTRDNFPRMDGSTSLAPLATAVAARILGESEEDAADLVNFNRTTQSYRNMYYGECDLLFASEPNAAVFDEAKEMNFSFDMEAISTEALVFVVNADNPVDNLTTDQIRDIYSGKITNWKEVGGDDLEISAFQRNSGAGSQALMEKLVMGDTPMADAPEEYMISSMGELMEAVRSYDNSANAIGYSVYYYANDMRMAEGLKIISVDGVAPEDKTIRDGEYPHRNAYYCVISSEAAADSPQRQIYDWMVSPGGQRLVASQGYVSVMDIDEMGDTQTTSNLFTRKSPDKITKLEASDDYGMIYPFIGSSLGSDDSNGYGGILGYEYGMIDEKGCIILDPLYTKVEYAHYRDYSMGEDYYLPYWILGRCIIKPEAWEDGTPEYEEDGYSWYYTIASTDGSYVSDKEYGYYCVGEFGIILADSYDSRSFIILDDQGKVILDSEKMPWRDRLSNVPLCSLYYGDGLFTLELDDGFYYMNMKGELVLGPYSNADRFTNGRASVSMDDQETYGLIDKKGHWIIPTGTYTGIGEFGKSSFTVIWQNAGDTSYSSIIDRKGNMIYEGDPNHYCYTYRDYFLVNSYTDENVQIYDSKGQLLKDINMENSYLMDEMNIIYTWDSDLPGIHFRNLFNDLEMTIEGEDLSPSGIIVDAEEFFETDNRLLLVSSYEENYRADLYDPVTMKPLLTGSRTIRISIDPFTRKAWVHNSPNGSRVELYSLETNSKGESSLEKRGSYQAQPVIYNDLLMVTDDRCCQWIDSDGEVFFRYSLVHSYDD